MTSGHSHAFAERAAVEGEHRLANITGASRSRWSCGSASLVRDRKEEAVAARAGLRFQTSEMVLEEGFHTEVRTLSCPTFCLHQLIIEAMCATITSG